MIRLLLILFMLTPKVFAAQTPQDNPLKQQLTTLKKSLLILKNKLETLQQKLEPLNEKLNVLQKPPQKDLDAFGVALEAHAKIDSFDESVIFTFFKESKIRKQPALIWLINQILKPENKYPTESLQNALEKIHRTRIQEVLTIMYKNQAIPIYLTDKITKLRKTIDITTAIDLLMIVQDSLFKSNDSTFIQACLDEMLATIINNMFANSTEIDFDQQFQILEAFLIKSFNDKPLLKVSMVASTKRLLGTIDPKYKDQKDKIEALLS